jgi:hypothetical protein
MTEKPTPPTALLIAADKFRNSLIPRADAYDDQGGAHMWYGWAVFDAFLAGAEWQANKDKK